MSQHHKLDDYVQIHVAARMVGYSCRMLCHLIETGELSAQRCGKRAWKVRPLDLYQCFQRRLRAGKLRQIEAVIQFLESIESRRTTLSVQPNLLVESDRGTIYSTSTLGSRRRLYADYEELVEGHR